MSRQIQLFAQAPKRTRRKRVSFRIGVLHESRFSVAGIERILKDYGMKVKVLRCGLSGFSRFIVDAGYANGEDLLSLAGYRYGQVATLEVYTCSPQKARNIIRACGVEFEDEILGENIHLFHKSEVT